MGQGSPLRCRRGRRFRLRRRRLAGSPRPGTRHQARRPATGGIVSSVERVTEVAKRWSPQPTADAEGGRGLVRDESFCNWSREILPGRRRRPEARLTFHCFTSGCCPTARNCPLSPVTSTSNVPDDVASFYVFTNVHHTYTYIHTFRSFRSAVPLFHLRRRM